MKLLRNIVNGKLLNQYNNQPVSIIGCVSHISPSKQSLEIRTVDNVTVTVNLATPYFDALEGYIQVHGISRGNSVTAEELITFSQQQCEDFDVSGHDQLCLLLNSIPDPYKYQRD